MLRDFSYNNLVSAFKLIRKDLAALTSATQAITEELYGNQDDLDSRIPALTGDKANRCIIITLPVADSESGS